MGFFDRILKRGKAYGERRNPALACELTLCGERYLLEEFDLDLEKETGRRYLPISLIFSGQIAPELERWIVRSSERKEGMVRFYRNKYDEKGSKLDEGARHTLRFYEASCIGLRREVRGETTTTTLMLSAKRISFGDEEYEG